MTGDLCSCLAIKSGCLEVEGLDTQHLDDQLVNAATCNWPPNGGGGDQRNCQTTTDFSVSLKFIFLNCKISPCFIRTPVCLCICERTFLPYSVCPLPIPILTSPSVSQFNTAALRGQKDTLAPAVHPKEDSV